MTAEEREAEMDWKRYFEAAKGTGYLATANREGEVDIAVYSRPHVIDAETVAFGMTDRLTHANLRENPHAAYAFREGGFQGVRLYLEMAREETEGPLLDAIRARATEIVGAGAGEAVEFAVYFHVRKWLPLVGP